MLAARGGLWVTLVTRSEFRDVTYGRLQGDRTGAVFWKKQVKRERTPEQALTRTKVWAGSSLGLMSSLDDIIQNIIFWVGQMMDEKDGNSSLNPTPTDDSTVNKKGREC